MPHEAILGRLNSLRDKTRPEQRRFVDWAAGQLHDDLVVELVAVGFPLALAEEQARGVVRAIVLATIQKLYDLRQIPELNRNN